MKVTREKIENSQAYLTVEIDPIEVEESMEKSFRRLVQSKRVPGFRKGKTPRAIFERYYTRKSLLDDALEDLLPEAYQKAIKEQEIEPIASPQIEVTQTEPVVFKAIVPLKPVVKLGDYQQIRIAEELPKEVTDKEVNDVIESLRHEHATWEPVNREVKSGDMITLDIWSEVDGKPFINQKGTQYTATAGDAFPVTGFAEQIIGMKRDEEKEFSLPFPADDPRVEVAGKEGKFKIRINEIKEEKLPEINDDFAKLIGQEYPTIEALREMVLSRLKQRSLEIVKNSYEESVVNTVVSQSEIQFPQILVDGEIHHMMDQRFQTRQQFEAYLKSVNKTEEEVHTEFHEQANEVAVKRVKQSLVLDKLAEDQKAEVSDSEIDADIERMLKDMSEQNRTDLSKTLNKPDVRESIRQRLLTRKTIDKLVEIAKSPAETKAEKEESK